MNTRPQTDTDRLQESIDTFYWENGSCCAGCDHWRALNAMAGECTLSPPVSGADRAGAVGISNCSLHIPAGHIPTRRDHKCGEFKDDFDWASLPLAYQKRVGAI